MKTAQVLFREVVKEAFEVCSLQVGQFEDELFTRCWFDGTQQIETFKLEGGVEKGLDAFGRNSMAQDGQQSQSGFIL